MLNNEISEVGSPIKFTAKEILFKYLAYLPFFLLSLVVFIGLTFFYIRYKEPLYKASARMWVKGDERSAARSTGQTDVVENALFGGKRINLDNEIELIRSITLMKRVVSKYGFNTNYYFQGKIRATNIYLDAPFVLVPIHILDSNKSTTLIIDKLDASGGVLHTTEKDKGTSFQWNKEFNFSASTWVLKNRNPVAKPNEQFKVVWKPISTEASTILNSLTIAALNPKTSILQLSIVNVNVAKAQDILNSIIFEYNASGIEDKNKVSQNTIRFINDRLALVTSELSGVEGNLESFRGNNQVFNVETQSQMYLSNSQQIQNSLQALGIQQRVAQMLYDYINQPTNNNTPVPSVLGIEDPTLVGLIAHYNELQLKKQRETPLVTGNNLMLEDIANQISEVRKSMLENLRNIQKNLQLQVSSFKSIGGETQALLSSIPRKERGLKVISRQQGVQEGLYLYLLQKREETAISSASTVSNYFQIDPAAGSGTPVEPNKQNLYLVAISIGLLLPLSIIFVRDLANDKVTLRSDIFKETRVPLIGEVGHYHNRERSLVVSTNDRSVLSEQFRIIRTNLQFLIKKTPNPVLMVTSTVAGEGKTFCSMNLAAVFAVTGKKTVILELDLRKPKISKALGLVNTKGITNYLLGIVEAEELPVPVEGTPNLFVIPAGIIPPNPAEMLLDERMGELFAYLKTVFDYIIIDTAPTGLVSDSKVLGSFADTTIYIVRQRFTLKKQLGFVEEQYVEQNLPNMALLVNDVKVGGYNSYYGYGYGYGYGSSYNYGYSYRYGDDENRTLWQKLKARFR